MKGKIIGFALGIGLILLLASGFIGDLFKFVLWFIMLDNSAPETSILGGIVVRLLTFVLSFGLVGLLFNLIDYHEKNLMSFSYFVTSIVIGFILSWIVWVLEQYILYIGIGLGVLVALIAIAWLIVFFLNKRKEKRHSSGSSQTNDANSSLVNEALE